MAGIILFDGLCNLCSGSVQFILKRDPEGYFKYASLQGDMGSRFLKEYGIPDNVDSIVLIEDDKFHVKSDAVLKICRNLKGGWRFFAVFQMLPRSLRDFLYDFMAKNRYRWFGKRESCMLPTEKVRKRFLE
jgi:predicted DCC family thiol-disulfide oxidoreductase YuxK